MWGYRNNYAEKQGELANAAFIGNFTGKLTKTMRVRWIYVVAAALGFTGVVAGALGAHALKNVLEPAQLDSFETAVRFQMYHALALLTVGALADKFRAKRLIQAGWIMFAGVLLFSGSIYLLVLTPLKPGLVTPIGGLVLMVAWVWIGVWGWQRK